MLQERRERSSVSDRTSCYRSVVEETSGFSSPAPESRRDRRVELRRPICPGVAREARLLLAVVVIAGEFIVGIQIVRPDFNGLSFGVTAEIGGHRRGSRSLLFAQQKRDR